MTFINSFLGSITAQIMGVLAHLPPWIGVTLWSLTSAVVILLIFRVSSNQEKMAEAKKAIHACLFEIRLFNDDLRKIFKAQGEIFRHNSTYLRLSLVPMIWILPIIVLLISHLQPYYGYDALTPGKPTIVSMHFTSTDTEGEGSTVRPEVSLQVPEGVTVDSPGIWIPARSEFSWRIVPQRSGKHELRIVVGGSELTKEIVVGDDDSARSPLRFSTGLTNQILYPIESLLPQESGVDSISVRYIDGSIDTFGFEWNWMVFFFVLSIVFAFALRKPLGVTI
ncbi:MAG: hypothetical protein GY906_12600 [bacterium]|nr:hypothetical protein [bacterium]